MMLYKYTPEIQYKVLQEVNDQCGPLGSKPVQLDVQDVDAGSISMYCRMLKELDMIDASVIKDMDGDVYFLIRITAKGIEYLSETNKQFWKYAQDVVSGVVEHWTGFDVSKAVEFFKVTWKKFNEEGGLDRD